MKESMATAVKKTLEQKNPVLEEMMRAGLHFGHKTSKTHPKMLPFIAGIRNTVHVIDLEKTKEKLEALLDYIRKLKEEGKILLFVGTKVQVQNLIKETALVCGMPFVAERWIGGTITNFETIKKRIDYLKELERQKKEGEWGKYTKKEQLDLQEQLKTLERDFGGLKSLEKLPDALFVCDLQENNLAVREAKKKNIPVLAIADTNTNPGDADHFIPANDDAISSVQYILNKVKELWG